MPRTLVDPTWRAEGIAESPLRGHVFVIENEPSVAELLRLALTSEGWTCTTASIARQSVVNPVAEVAA
jgi:hypothetical protein